MADHATDRALPPARFEPRDVGLRFILILFALIGGTLLLTLGLVLAVFPNALQDRRFLQPFPDFPTPRLQTSPSSDMRAFHAAEMARLNSVGWQDRRAGTLHIPIDLAMRAVAAEGIPGWPTARQIPVSGDHKP
jgi:hypothetical protein